MNKQRTHIVQNIKSQIDFESLPAIVAQYISTLEAANERQYNILTGITEIRDAQPKHRHLYGPLSKGRKAYLKGWQDAIDTLFTKVYDR